MPVTVDEVMSFAIHTAGPLTRKSEERLGWVAYERKYLDLAKNPFWKTGFERDMQKWKSWKMTVFDKRDLAPLLDTSDDELKNRIVRALYESL